MQYCKHFKPSISCSILTSEGLGASWIISLKLWQVRQQQKERTFHSFSLTWDRKMHDRHLAVKDFIFSPSLSLSFFLPPFLPSKIFQKTLPKAIKPLSRFHRNGCNSIFFVRAVKEMCVFYLFIFGRVIMENLKLVVENPLLNLLILYFYTLFLYN